MTTAHVTIEPGLATDFCVAWSALDAFVGDAVMAVMPMTSAQIRMARAALNWTVRDLAEATGPHRNTISNVEIGRYAGDPETLAAIKKVLKRAGVEFINENGGGPGVRLRNRQRPKDTKA